MTPAEHYARAESLLDYYRDGPPDEISPDDMPVTLAAVAHGLLAIAGEMGVPTGTTHTPSSSPPKLAQVANLGYQPVEPEPGT